MVMIFSWELCYQGLMSPVAGWEQTCPDMKTTTCTLTLTHTLFHSHPLFVSGQKYVRMYHWTSCASTSEGPCDRSWSIFSWHQSWCGPTCPTPAPALCPAKHVHWDWGLVDTLHFHMIFFFLLYDLIHSSIFVTICHKKVRWFYLHSIPGIKACAQYRFLLLALLI